MNSVAVNSRYSVITSSKFHLARNVEFLAPDRLIEGRHLLWVASTRGTTLADRSAVYRV
jgi:hypothetical protein